MGLAGYAACAQTLAAKEEADAKAHAENVLRFIRNGLVYCGSSIFNFLQDVSRKNIVFAISEWCS